MESRSKTPALTAFLLGIVCAWMIASALGGCAKTVDGKVDLSAEGLNTDAENLAKYWQAFSHGAAGELARASLALACPQCMDAANKALGKIDIAAAGILSGDKEAAVQAYAAARDLNKAVSEAGEGK